MSNLSLEKCIDHPRAGLWSQALTMVELSGGRSGRLVLMAQCGRSSEVILAEDICQAADSTAPQFIVARDTWTPDQLAAGLVVICELYFDAYRTKRARKLADGTVTRSPKEVRYTLKVIDLDGDELLAAALVLPHPSVYVEAEGPDPGDVMTRDQMQTRYIERIEGQLSVTTSYLMRSMEVLPRAIDSLEKAASAQQRIAEATIATMAKTYSDMGKLQADALQTSVAAEAKMLRAEADDGGTSFLETPSGQLVGEMLADAGVRIMSRTEDQWADLAAKVFTRVQEMTGKVKS